MILYQHQKKGIELALKNKGCAALFHEPGLGKTLTSLKVYEKLKQDEPDLKMLIICPLSLINTAWGVDITKFTYFSYKPFKLLKGNENPDITSINYESLISKRYTNVIMKYICDNNVLCVLDESSRLKNNKSITTKTVLKMSHYLKYKIILSGTPMPNNELELWGQINFIQPGVFDKSFYAFRNKYFHLERNGQTMITNGQILSRQMMRETMMKGWKYTITDFNRKHLMYKIASFTHWVKKEEALDLPEKVIQIREVNLSPTEVTAYNDMEKHFIAEVEGKTIATQVAIGKTMKLRQITGGFIYDEYGIPMIIGKSKLKELFETLEELGNQQVIIFAQFTYEINTIIDTLVQKNQTVTSLCGQTKDKDESIERFQNGKAKYLVAHTQSAAHGLTFTNCRTMIFYSYDYSYEYNTQAQDRIHRIGQNKKCLYIYLTAKRPPGNQSKVKTSIDEDIYNVLDGKKTLQEVIHGIVRNKS